MPIVTSYPGVYIEELFKLSLPIKPGATAVPMFAIEAVAAGTSLHFESWMEFISHASYQNTTPVDPIHRYLRAYFENGGGPCYLVNPASMATEVPKLPAVTMLVAAGEEISDAINLLCAPGKCLFALVDADDATALAVDGTWPAVTETAGRIAAHALPCTAAYYPSLTKSYQITAGANPVVHSVPASVVMAGIYCATDRSRGVWKAPANVSIGGGFQLMHGVTDAVQGNYNKDKALNMLREFRATGITVFGARTLQDDNNWRYLSVRRLFDAAERDIKRAMRFAVFEPNTAYTWTRVKGAIDNYLYNIWQLGGLQGERPEKGFFVQVGLGVTMSQEEIDDGMMIVRIGLAASRPAEFIILQFTQEMIHA